jgi:3-methyladenine DNA glycosylase AlkD
VTAKTLLETLRRALARAGDPERAAGMQAYMKSTMPYQGVPATPFRAICKEIVRAAPLPDADAWRALALGVFRGARFREEWYAAVEICADRRARAWQTMDSLPMYEEMITTARWWDVVDALATNRLGDVLASEPRPMRRAMLAWSKDGDMWKRRSAILCQIKKKGATDLELLYACIAPSIASKEFFLRKAIGWALRQYAWTDPDEVRRYVKAHPELSGLSKREALKNAKDELQ